MPANKLENLIEAELVVRVHAIGGVCEKMQAIGRRGFFDRIVVLPGGRIVFVELKRHSGGRVSPHQRDTHARYRALGVEVAIVRKSGDIDRLLDSKK